MLERNKIYCTEVMEGLKQLDDESVDLIITSPPYNKCGYLHYSTKGKRKGTTQCRPFCVAEVSFK